MITGCKHVPQRAVPGADRVSPSARFTFSTGNACVITPAYKYVDGRAGRMIIHQEWTTQPDENDLADLSTLLASVGMTSKADFVAQGTPGETMQAAEDWLRGGKPR